MIPYVVLHLCVISWMDIKYMLKNHMIKIASLLALVRGHYFKDQLNH